MHALLEKGPFAHQNYDEFMAMLAKLRGIESVLEIGSAHGHSLCLMALAAVKGAKVCTIDQGLDWAHLEEAVKELGRLGYDANAFHGDSKSPEAIAFAEEHGPFDFIFIDGDHSYAGAKADWESYGRLGKMVGFHDICHPHHDVSKLWAEIKETHKTEEIISNSRYPMGIGLVYR